MPIASGRVGVQPQPGRFVVLNSPLVLRVPLFIPEPTMDITVECPRCKRRYRIPEGQTGKHACPKCHGVTVVPAPPAKPVTGPSKPSAPSHSTVAPAQYRVTPPQPKPAQQPSTPSPPIRDDTTPTHVAPPDENALKSAEKKSLLKKSSIGLLAGGGIGLLCSSQALRSHYIDARTYHPNHRCLHSNPNHVRRRRRTAKKSTPTAPRRWYLSRGSWGADQDSWCRRT